MGLVFKRFHAYPWVRGVGKNGFRIFVCLLIIVNNMYLELGGPCKVSKCPGNSGSIVKFQKILNPFLRYNNLFWGSSCVRLSGYGVALGWFWSGSRDVQG